jgi:hypothetical protein
MRSAIYQSPQAKQLMHSNTIRELLTALQYLLIGIIAESCVILWFDQKSIGQRLAIWAAIAASLSAIRFVVLAFSEWTRKNDWQNVSRRNW